MASDAGLSEPGHDRKDKRRLKRFAAVRVIAVLMAAAVPFAIYVKLTVFTGEDILEAVQSGHRARVGYLLKKNPELVDGPSGGFPLLHVAARKKDLEMVRLLLAVGADPNTKSRLGRTPLHYMMDPTYLLWNWAAPAIVGALTEAGADVNARDAYGLTPLHIALAAPRSRRDTWEGRGPVAVLEALLAAGADVNAPGLDGTTPLHEAALWDDMELVGVLLRGGADPNVVDDAGRSPLLALLRRTPNCSRETVKLLLEAGADVNVTDRWGESPLRAACRSDRPWLVELLLAAGADVNAVTEDGKSVLDAAVWSGRNDIAELLRQHGATE